MGLQSQEGVLSQSIHFTFSRIHYPLLTEPLPVPSTIQSVHGTHYHSLNHSSLPLDTSRVRVTPCSITLPDHHRKLDPCNHKGRFHLGSWQAHSSGYCSVSNPFPVIPTGPTLHHIDCTILRDSLIEALLRIQYGPTWFLYYQHCCWAAKTDTVMRRCAHYNHIRIFGVHGHAWIP